MYFWDRSLRRWNDKLLRSDEGSYTFQMHRDWIDIHNSGISHFGLHPDQMPRNNIMLDVFHLRCAITRRLMTHLRIFLLKSPTEIQNNYTQLLRNFWNEYNIFIWTMNRPFTSFIGRELLNFIRNSDSVASFLKLNFFETDTLLDLCNGIIIWKNISPFLVIDVITNVETYEQKLETFKENFKKFYEIGKRSFLTKDAEKPGGDETFSMHALRLYMPMISQQTLSEHKMGLGVFTMQGFERRNKESKNTVKRFANFKGNMVESNLKRLWDIFFYEQNSY